MAAAAKLGLNVTNTPLYLLNNYNDLPRDEYNRAREYWDFYGIRTAGDPNIEENQREIGLSLLSSSINKIALYRGFHNGFPLQIDVHENIINFTPRVQLTPSPKTALWDLIKSLALPLIVYIAALVLMLLFPEAAPFCGGALFVSYLYYERNKGKAILPEGDPPAQFESKHIGQATLVMSQQIR